MRGSRSKAELSDLAAYRAAVANPVARLFSADPAAAAVIALVAGEKGVPLAQLFVRNRCRAEVAATRQLAMYLTHVMLGRRLTEIGQLFGRDRTTVSHACALIEDRRDSDAFDAEVGRLERAIENLATEPTTSRLEARHAS